MEKERHTGRFAAVLGYMAWDWIGLVIRIECVSEKLAVILAMARLAEV
jgi:hypothetical protein